MTTIFALIVAATLEICGDAAIRTGLLRSAWAWIALGAATLVAYGFVVNLNQTIAFGRLMGVYIAVFLVVSQAVSVLVLRESPSIASLVGGLLIVAGGTVIQLGPRLF